LNPTQKKELKQLFVSTALYFNHTIADTVLALYVEDLKDLNFDEVAQALGELRRDPKTQKCPLPAQIRAHLRPELSDGDRAMLAVSEIVEAVARVGAYQKPQLSPLAEEVVKQEGGWMAVCERLTNDNLTFYKAQWRDLARGLIAQGHPNSARAALPQSSGMRQLASLSGGSLSDEPVPPRKDKCR
jgi:hypothetical protein